MWGSKTKNKAVDAWHTKAMMVDPKKTKITIIWNTESKICEAEKHSETRAPNVETEHPKNIMASNAYHAKGIEPADHNFETAEQNFQKMESNTDETPDFDEITQKLETPKTNFEILESWVIKARNKTFSEGSVENTLEHLGDMEPYYETAEFDGFETLSTYVTLDDLENPQPSQQSMASIMVEAQNHLQSKEDMGEQNLEIVEPKPPEAVNTIASSENLTVEQTNEIEAGTACEAEDSNSKLMPIDKGSEKTLFLGALQKTRSQWYNDKKFAKIVQKMEKGKKLKGKEFEQVYTRIRNYCQYN
jgi:hypothetical protein